MTSYILLPTNKKGRRMVIWRVM